MIFTSEYKVNTKTKRLKELRRTSTYRDSIPSSYKINSLKEELCFEYISKFSEEYKKVHPHRKPLLLVADNEVGVKKFVCTTVKPTQIPYHEFYDINECADFMSTFMQYEPLDPPFATPKVLCSPTYTFENYSGDCFEISNLICSFLIGAGYDAYVVSGYAPKSITLKDQTKMRHPTDKEKEGGGEVGGVGVTLNRPGISGNNARADSRSDEKGGKRSSDEHNNKSNSSNKENIENGAEFSYPIIKNFVKDSIFLKSIADKQAMALQDNFELWIPDKLTNAGQREEEAAPRLSGLSVIHGKHLKSKGLNSKDRMQNNSDMNIYLNPERRVHSWVLVRAGRRDQQQDVFVEPSTGEIFQCSDSPYFGVESVWNHVNYWINTKPFEKVSRMDFDINDESFWESLFIESNLFSKKKTTESDKNKDNNEQDENDLLGGAANNSLHANGVNGGAGASADAQRLVRLMDSPPTWVASICLERPRYLLRYPPSGRKTINYYCSKVEYFARFSHPQCTVSKLTVFLDEMCTIVKEIHEDFDGRKDKMYRRSRYYLGKQYIVEHYLPGSKDEVKQWTEYPGKLIEVEFHVEGRLDRLTKRVDTVGSQSVEYFSGRPDRLICRTVSLTLFKPIDVMGARLSLPGYGLGSDLYVTQLDLEYAMDPTVERGTDIRKRIFHIQEGKLVTLYHFAKDQVTGNVTTLFHTKLPGSVVPSEMALSQEEGLLKDSLPLQQASAHMERESYNNYKIAHQQMRNLHLYRLQFEYNIESERNIFDFALDKADKDLPVIAPTAGNVKPNTKIMMVPAGKSGSIPGSLAGEPDKKPIAVTLAVDYLQPYLRHVKDANSLTREEAMEIRINCLEGCKSRLIERANIIHNRLNDENFKLSRRQEHFQRSQRDGDVSTEDYERYCTEAMFRIQILEQRLVVHEEMALKKYAEVDAKLVNDPRLKVLRI